LPPLQLKMRQRVEKEGNESHQLFKAQVGSHSRP
jgi:hypothetical protein